MGIRCVLMGRRDVLVPFSPSVLGMETAWRQISLSDSKAHYRGTAAMPAIRMACRSPEFTKSEGHRPDSPMIVDKSRFHSLTLGQQFSMSDNVYNSERRKSRCSFGFLPRPRRLPLLGEQMNAEQPPIGRNTGFSWAASRRF